MIKTITTAILLTTLTLAGCATPTKTQKKEPSKIEGGSIEVGNKNSAIGTVELRYSNAKYIDGYQTIIVYFDKIPFHATFDNCALAEAKNCKSRLALWDTGFSTKSTSLQVDLTYLLNTKVESGIILPTTKNIANTYGLSNNVVEHGPTKEITVKGTTYLVEDLEIELSK